MIGAFTVYMGGCTGLAAPRMDVGTVRRSELSAGFLRSTGGNEPSFAASRGLEGFPALVLAPHSTTRVPDQVY